MFLALATGMVLSRIYTTAVAVVTFPLWSVTVAVTIFSPILEQSNVYNIRSYRAVV